MPISSGKKSPFVLSGHHGQSILDHLKALGTLPEKGYLAGQAVSSAVFDLLVDDGEGLSVYNDLDVFSEATPEDIAAAKEADRTLDTVDFVDCEIFKDYSSFRFSYTRSYDVVNSSRDGLVNNVLITNLMNSSRGSRLNTLLSGFDMNCTQVGVDLSTGELEWTPAFEEFVSNRQLLISNVQTPNHTALRWFKKRNELPGAYGNDEQAMELISLMNVSKGIKGDQRRKESKCLRWRFGDKNADLYKKYKGNLGSYYDLIQDDTGFYFLEPKHTPDQDLINRAKSYPARAIPKMYLELKLPRKASKMKKVARVLDRVDQSPSDTLSLILASYWEQGMSYLSNNVSLDKLKEMEDYVRSSYRAILVDILWGLTGAEQIRDFEKWKALERRYGRWIFGNVELFIRRYDFVLSTDDWEEVIRDEYVKFYADDSVLFKRDPFTLEIGSYSCRELFTPSGLRLEGRELKHCVGGYAREVYKGSSRIFSIRHEDQDRWSTLELCRCCEDEDVWYIRQHFTFSNNKPHQDTEKFADVVLVNVNAPLLTEIVEARVPEPMQGNHSNEPARMDWRDKYVVFTLRLSNLLSDLIEGKVMNFKGRTVSFLFLAILTTFSLVGINTKSAESSKEKIQSKVLEPTNLVNPEAVDGVAVLYPKVEVLDYAVPVLPVYEELEDIHVKEPVHRLVKVKENGVPYTDHELRMADAEKVLEARKAELIGQLINFGQVDDEIYQWHSTLNHFAANVEAHLALWYPVTSDDDIYSLAKTEEYQYRIKLAKESQEHFSALALYEAGAAGELLSPEEADQFLESIEIENYLQDVRLYLRSVN